VYFTRLVVIGVATVSLVAAISATGFAQQKAATIAPAAPLKDGWEDIDQRLVFLMVDDFVHERDEHI
jgi:hypothetical protein